MKLIYLTLKKLLTWLVKKGLIKVPHKMAYMAHVMVMLDGNKIKEFPAEVLAYSRRGARRHILKNVKFTSGTTAIGGEWVKGGRKFYVRVYVRYEGKIINQFAATVIAKKRREAKFDISHRLGMKIGAVALKMDLIKHA